MTSYFKKFPIIDYDVKGTGKIFLQVPDILRRIRVRQNIVDNVVIFDKYFIESNERPDIVAFKQYSDSDLYWIILLINGYTNPYYHWPLDYPELTRFVEKKYSSGLSGIHHYEDSDGFVVDSTQGGAIPVTNLIYEEVKNEEYRSIKILKNKFVPDFISEFNSLVNS